MTLTEIEDSVILAMLNRLGRITELDHNVRAHEFECYLAFLQAAEIRRRLVGWQDPEKPCEIQPEQK